MIGALIVGALGLAAASDQGRGCGDEDGSRPAILILLRFDGLTDDDDLLRSPEEDFWNPKYAIVILTDDDLQILTEVVEFLKPMTDVHKASR